MKIAEIKHIEDCFDGSFIHEILFDAEITSEFIQSLATHGELHYYPSFARPFFRLVVPSQFTLKGVEGNRTVRVLSYEKDLKVMLEHLTRCIAGYEDMKARAGGEGKTRSMDAVRNLVV
jgi:hypothetical protein